MNYPEIPRPGFMTLGRNADGSTEIYLSGYAGEPPGGTFYTVRRSRAGLNVFSGLTDLTEGVPRKPYYHVVTALDAPPGRRIAVLASRGDARRSVSR
ncbi:MAG: hypothetical protein QOD41_3776 [Cryptosporangiaceae bacterium]|nr:hypothetical protein [Cryptosporangiaceae bacterium]